jgi:hypothetical protein
VPLEGNWGRDDNVPLAQDLSTFHFPPLSEITISLVEFLQLTLPMVIAARGSPRVNPGTERTLLQASFPVDIIHTCKWPMLSKRYGAQTACLCSNLVR